MSNFCNAGNIMQVPVTVIHMVDKKQWRCPSVFFGYFIQFYGGIFSRYDVVIIKRNFTGNPSGLLK